MTKKPRLGIGALSRATGIHTNTIRTWERRYGVPNAERTGGGHRTYDGDVVEHLTLVKRALAQGHRPASIFAMTQPELHEMLDAHTAVPSGIDDGEDRARDADRIRACVNALRELDADRLDRLLAHALAELGIVDFLDRCASPFLVELGRSWSEGKLTVYQEHFGSARLSSFMESHWRDLALGNSGPGVVLAGLPDELHSGGLHMAAWVLARRGWQIVFVGPNCPVEQIEQAARQSRATVIGLSIAASARPDEVQRHVDTLMRSRPGATVIIGGAGGIEHPDCVRLSHLRALDDWARNHGAMTR